MKSRMKSVFSGTKTPEAAPLLDFFKIQAFFVFQFFSEKNAEYFGRMCGLFNRAPYLPTEYHKRS